MSSPSFLGEGLGEQTIVTKCGHRCPPCDSFGKFLQNEESIFLFIISDKSRVKGEYQKGCRCGGVLKL